MTKAPERIYMDGDIEAGEGYWTRCFETPKPCSEPVLTYILFDLVDPAAIREAALREAAASVKTHFNIARAQMRKARELSVDISFVDAWSAIVAHLDREHDAILALIDKKEG